jgi:hypothetical protein
MWYEHTKKQRGAKKVQLNENSLYAAPEEIVTNQIPGATDFITVSRSENPACSKKNLSQKVHEFNFAADASVNDQLDQWTENERVVSCDPCLMDKNKRGKEDCHRTEQPLSISDKSMPPAFISFNNSGGQKETAEIMNAWDSLLIDGVKYSKTMVMVREDPINSTTEIAHLTALVRRDSHWLRYKLKYSTLKLN